MMLNYTTEQLSTWTEGTWSHAPASGVVAIRGFNNDSRHLKKEEAFVALRTTRRDGHTFLENVASAGASAALVEKVYEDIDLPQLQVKDSLTALQKIAREHRLQFPGTVIGVTGSCGKTSTKDLLGLLLGEKRTLRTRANHNNFLGVPITLSHLDAERHTFAVVEAGINQPDEMDVLAEMIQPDLTVITAIAPTHLEKMGSLENIAHEKTRLAKVGKAREGVVIFPKSCLKYKPFQELAERSLVLCPEGKPSKRFQAKDFVYYKTKTDNVSGCRLTIQSATFREQEYALPQLSKGMISNVCLAIIAANQCGIAPEQIQATLAQWKPTSMRGEIKTIGDRTFYIDCYNANPASMVDAFDAFAHVMDSALPRLYVLGCMGELGVQGNELHFATGLKLKLRNKDRAIIIGHHATAMCEGIIEAGNRMDQVTLFSTLSEIKQEVQRFKGAVLLKGSRSYELEKVIE